MFINIGYWRDFYQRGVVRMHLNGGHCWNSSITSSRQSSSEQKSLKPVLTTLTIKIGYFLLRQN